jgi:hypothetical protein
MAGIEQRHGQPQEHPQQEQRNIKRRRLLRDGAVTAVGIGVYAITKIDANNTLNNSVKQVLEQSARASREVEAEGITRPDPEVVRDALNLRERLKDPLEEAPSDVKRAAKDVLKLQDKYDKAHEQHLTAIHEKEGSYSGRTIADGVGQTAGIVATMVGGAKVFATVLETPVRKAISWYVERLRNKNNPQPPQGN